MADKKANEGERRKVELDNVPADPAHPQGQGGAQVKFREVIEREPWDVFAEEKGDFRTSETTVKVADAVVVAKAYHMFLEKHNPELMRCILCGRRFKARKGNAS